MYSKGEMNNNWIQAKKKCIEAPDFIGDDLAEFFYYLILPAQRRYEQESFEAIEAEISLI